MRLATCRTNPNAVALQTANATQANPCPRAICSGVPTSRPTAAVVSPPGAQLAEIEARQHQRIETEPEPGQTGDARSIEPPPDPERGGEDGNRFGRHDDEEAHPRSRERSRARQQSTEPEREDGGNGQRGPARARPPELGEANSEHRRGRHCRERHRPRRGPASSCSRGRSSAPAATRWPLAMRGRADRPERDLSTLPSRPRLIEIS